MVFAVKEALIWTMAMISFGGLLQYLDGRG